MPLVFVGEAPATEATGGILFTSLDHIKVRALPADLPREITVDVSPSSTWRPSSMFATGAWSRTPSTS